MVYVPQSLITVQMFFGYRRVAKYFYYGLIVKINVNFVMIRHDFPFISLLEKPHMLQIFSKISSTVRINHWLTLINFDLKPID